MDLSPVELFQESLIGINTVKDKVFEVASIMLGHKKQYAEQLVQQWLQHFLEFQDERRKLAMLYVMNEVVLQNGRDSTETQYLNEFPKIMDQILSNLGESRSEALLQELKKIVLVWDDPTNQVFVDNYIQQLKNRIEEIIENIIDERTGATIIKEYEIGLMLENFQKMSDKSRNQFKEVEKMLNSKDVRHTNLNTEDLRGWLEQQQAQIEKTLIENTRCILQCSKLLTKEYKDYEDFPGYLDDLLKNNN